MAASFSASNGARIRIWPDATERDVFHARRLNNLRLGVQTCLAVDLFEIVANLAELDLEDPDQAAEAMAIAAWAERRRGLRAPDASQHG
jgi:hypothetical protein